MLTSVNVFVVSKTTPPQFFFLGGGGTSPGFALREKVNSMKDTPVYPANVAVRRPQMGKQQNNIECLENVYYQ